MVLRPDNKRRLSEDDETRKRRRSVYADLAPETVKSSVLRAVWLDDAVGLRASLRQDKRAVVRRALCGEMPLHSAIRLGKSVEIARVLLEHGAPCDAPSSLRDGWLPLHAAIKLNNYLLVRLLLEFGANPTIPCGLLPFQMATDPNVKALLLAALRSWIDLTETPPI